MGSGNFADVEAFIVADLARAIPALGRRGLLIGVSLEWPSERWDQYLPVSGSTQYAFARVQRIGGGDDGVTTDEPIVDIALLGREPGFVKNVAEDIRTRYTRYPRVIEHSGRSVVFAKARTVTAPQRVDWSDPGMTHIFASYAFRTRR